MARKVYTHSEDVILFAGDSPTAGQVPFTVVGGLQNGSGAISDPINFGSGARPTLYEWRAWAKTVGETDEEGSVNIYLCTGHDNMKGQFWDAGLGSGQRALSDTRKLRNLQWVGAIETEGSGTQPIYTSGLVNIYSQRAAVVMWNQTGVDFESGPSGTIGFTLTPVPDEIQ